MPFFHRIGMESRFCRFHPMILLVFILIPALISCNTGQTLATPREPLSKTIVPTRAPQITRPPPLTSRIDVLAGCIQAIDVSTHFHVQLTITLHGDILPIPSGIGMEGGCIHPLHTHADNGIIHIEHALTESFTLEDFFLVGRRPGGFNPLAGRRVVRVLVNGKQYPFDYRTLPLADGLEISLELVRVTSA